MGLLLLAFDAQKIDEVRKNIEYFEVYLELAIERAPRRPHLTLLQVEHLHGELVASLACSTVNANYEGSLQARLWDVGQSWQAQQSLPYRNTDAIQNRLGLLDTSRLDTS